MKPKARKKPSGAVNRRLRRLETAFVEELQNRQKQAVEVCKNWLARNDKTIQRLVAIEKRVTMLEDGDTLTAVEQSIRGEVREKHAHVQERVSGLQQRLAEAEQLIVTLTEQFQKRDPTPFGMTKHLHQREQRCAACSVPADYEPAFPMRDIRDCPTFPHTHTLGGVDVVCKVGQ